MTGIENMLIAMAILFTLMGILWVVGHLDQWVQKTRGVEADKYGRRPDGAVAKVVLAAVIIGGFIWYVGSGSGPIDPEFTYRR